MGNKILMNDYQHLRKQTVVQTIIRYANQLGLEKKNGAFFKDGRYYGNLFSVGREAGIDMGEGK